MRINYELLTIFTDNAQSIFLHDEQFRQFKFLTLYIKDTSISRLKSSSCKIKTFAVTLGLRKNHVYKSMILQVI